MNRTETDYLEREVMSRSPERLVPLMYDHLLANLRRAQSQIESRDLEGKATSLQKASAIISELRATLDFEKGGDLAQRLAALYAYFASELLTVGRSLDTLLLGRIIGMVASLHEAWEKAAVSTATTNATTRRPVLHTETAQSGLGELRA
ncbi:MAG: flagellar export chaperone FliS [Gemmatimonadota bacterium]|nr:flagellar export chaperone FliS [Gemmatimonadota bacterium]